MDAEIVRQLALSNDLSSLTDDQRYELYVTRCEQLGLDVASQPLQFITVPAGKGRVRLIMYANKACAAQLRQLHGISITDLSQIVNDNEIVVTVKGCNAAGRCDADTGTEPLIWVDDAGKAHKLRPDQRANAIMTAVTKAKMRLTYALAGLAILDESEVNSIPGAQRQTTTSFNASDAQPGPANGSHLPAAPPRSAVSESLPPPVRPVPTATRPASPPAPSPPQRRAVSPGTAAPQPRNPSRVISEAQARRLYAIGYGRSMDAKQLNSWLLSSYGFAAANAVTVDLYNEICATLEPEADSQQQAPSPEPVEAPGEPDFV